MARLAVITLSSTNKAAKSPRHTDNPKFVRLAVPNSFG
jgi:hypothetical protein